MRYSLALLAALPAIALADCGAPTWQAIDAFTNNPGCVPGGYLSASDLGNTSPDDADARCKAQCGWTNGCKSYVASLWSAADSSVYTGQCFYYNSAPSGPAGCVDHPSLLVAGALVDMTTCLANPDAIAYCNSVNGVTASTVTVYTATVTPLATSYTTDYSTKTTTKKTVETTSTTSTRTVTTITRVTPFTTTKSATAFTTTTIVRRQDDGSGADALTPPACLPTDSELLSQACACVTAATVTVSTDTTLATTATTVVPKTTKATVSTEFTTSTRVVSLKETSTLTTISTITKPVVSTTFVTTKTRTTTSKAAITS